MGEAGRVGRPVLRREGLYSSSLRTWRALQHDAGELAVDGFGLNELCESEPEGRPRTSASLNWTREAQRASRGSWSKPKRSSRSKKKSPRYWGCPLKNPNQEENN